MVVPRVNKHIFSPITRLLFFCGIRHLPGPVFKARNFMYLFIYLFIYLLWRRQLLGQLQETSRFFFHLQTY